MGGDWKMKAIRKFVEGDEAVSAVIGVILMVAITVAIAATVYVYVSGLASSPGEQKENAGVAVTTESSMIKITLTDGGDNMATTGYTEQQIKILNNGTELIETNIGGLTWTVGEALWVGSIGVSPFTEELGDLKGEVDALLPGVYAVTVVIVDTVIYDGPVTIS